MTSSSKSPQSDFGQPPSAVASSDAEFSLVLGGPLYQMLLSTHLARPPLELVHRRILIFLLIIWAPLAILAAFSGNLAGGVGIPFLLDLDTHVKFLVTVPMLIVAELVVHRRIRAIVEQFLERGIIAADDLPRFNEILRRVLRLRNSVAIEIAMLVFVMTGGYWLWRSHAILTVATWYAHPVDGSIAFTPAGTWYAFVSLPIARFLLVRWFFRLFIWYLLLWRVSRLPLRLNALHPDGAGGIGFLAGSVDALAPLLFALSALVSGLIANQIWHAHASLPQFKMELLGSAALLALIVLIPLTFFALQLAAARRAGLREFGLLSSRYADDFAAKWHRGPRKSDDSPLGTGDIQSLADLANSYSVVHKMKSLPFGKEAVVRLVIAIAIPMLPLALTMVPFEEIVNRLIRLAL